MPMRYSVIPLDLFYLLFPLLAGWRFTRDDILVVIMTLNIRIIDAVILFVLLYNLLSSSENLSSIQRKAIKYTRIVVVTSIIITAINFLEQSRYVIEGNTIFVRFTYIFFLIEFFVKTLNRRRIKYVTFGWIFVGFIDLPLTLLFPDIAGMRISSFITKNRNNATLQFVGVLLLYRWYEKKILNLGKFIGFSLPPFIVLLMTGSRTGLLGIVLIAIYHMKKYARMIVLEVLLCVGIAVILLMTPMSEIFSERIRWTVNEINIMLESLSEFSLSKNILEDGYRSWWVMLWHFIVLLSTIDPLTGVGFGSVPLLIFDIFGMRAVQLIHGPALMLHGELLGFSLHNSYADLIIGFGIPFSILILFLVLKVMLDHRYSYHITGIFLIQFMAESFFHPTVTGNGVAMYCLPLMIGLAIWYNSSNNITTKDEPSKEGWYRKSKFYKILLESKYRALTSG